MRIAPFLCPVLCVMNDGNLADKIDVRILEGVKKRIKQLTAHAALPAAVAEEVRERVQARSGDIRIALQVERGAE